MAKTIVKKLSDNTTQKLKQAIFDELKIRARVVPVKDGYEVAVAEEHKEKFLKSASYKAVTDAAKIRKKLMDEDGDDEPLPEGDPKDDVNEAANSIAFEVCDQIKANPAEDIDVKVTLDEEPETDFAETAKAEVEDVIQNEYDWEGETPKVWITVVVGGEEEEDKNTVTVKVTYTEPKEEEPAA